MAVCVLVASGADFDVDEYLTESPFEPQQIYRKGDIPAPGNPEQEPLAESGFVLLVGQEDYPELMDQVFRALDYWDEELHELSAAGADKLVLNFGVAQEDLCQHPYYLPPELIAALHRLEMGLIFSVVREPKP
jgi:hypothetical protein